MSGRAFSNPNFGTQARVEVFGKEVRLTFVASTSAKADDLAENIVRQLRKGAINITMMGRPTSVVEE